MITDKCCEEVVELIIDIVTGLPNIAGTSKLKLRASEGFFKEAVKENKEKYEESLKRIHYWLESNNIGISHPPENDNKNK